MGIRCVHPHFLSGDVLCVQVEDEMIQCVVCEDWLHGRVSDAKLNGCAGSTLLLPVWRPLLAAVTYLPCVCSTWAVWFQTVWGSWR